MALSSPPADRIATRAAADGAPPRAPERSWAPAWRGRTGAFAAMFALGVMMLSWAFICVLAAGGAALVATDAADLLLVFARSLAELGGALVLLGLLREWVLPACWRRGREHLDST